MSSEEYKYKRQALCAAKQLGYHPSIIERLKNAQTEAEIERIMHTARTSGR